MLGYTTFCVVSGMSFIIWTTHPFEPPEGGRPRSAPSGRGAVLLIYNFIVDTKSW
jgi:hypothetical protein